MSEERSNGSKIVTYIAELFVGALRKFFTMHQRTSRNASTLSVTPDQFIGVEVRCVARQEVQGQLALRADYVVLHACLLVSGQTVHNEMDDSSASVHQFFEQGDEQLSRESVLIGIKPESAPGVDRGCRAHALALTGTFDHRRFTALRPRLAVNRVSPETGFTCFQCNK
jgi:hypothetical protein